MDYRARWKRSLDTIASGQGGGLHSSPTLSAARASIATISGSESGTVDHPEGDNGTEPSSPEWSDSPSDAAIDIRSSGGAPKDTSGTPPPLHECVMDSNYGVVDLIILSAVPQGAN